MLHYVFVSRLAARNPSLPVVTTEPPFPSTWQRGESLPSLPTRRSEVQWCPWRPDATDVPTRPVCVGETVQGFARLRIRGHHHGHAPFGSGRGNETTVCSSQKVFPPPGSPFQLSAVSDQRPEFRRGSASRLGMDSPIAQGPFPR